MRQPTSPELQVEVAQLESRRCYPSFSMVVDRHTGKRIYVDLDDVLAQTILGLVERLRVWTGREVRKDDVLQFDLGHSFGLAPDELREFMDRVHRDEELRALEPMPGAADSLRSWSALGHEIWVMTGRPPSTEETSRTWLKECAIPHDKLVSVDKYGRPDRGGGPAPLPLSQVAELGFTLAVEDSLATAAYLVEHCGVPVVLVDQPWNRDLSGIAASTASAIKRCHSWNEIAVWLGPSLA